MHFDLASLLAGSLGTIAIIYGLYRLDPKGVHIDITGMVKGAEAGAAKDVKAAVSFVEAEAKKV